MNIDCKEIKDMVIQTFANNTNIKTIEEGCEITLPLLDPLNDFVRIYVVPSSDGYKFTDFGTVTERLRDLNVELRTTKRNDIFEAILKTNGIRYHKEMLIVDVKRDIADFQNKLILYIHAITSINDMEILAQPQKRGDFKQYVWEHIEEKGYEFIPNYVATVPKLGTLQFDFLLEDKLILETLHALNVQYAKTPINDILVKFGEVEKSVKNYRRAVIYNDESAVSEASRFKLLNNVLSVPPISWAERETGIDNALAIA